MADSDTTKNEPTTIENEPTTIENKPATNENGNSKSVELNTSSETEIDSPSKPIENTHKNEIYNERSAFYKKPIKRDNYKLEIDFNETPQEIRRQRLLYYQKKNREDAFNSTRGLLEDVLNSDNEEEMEEAVCEELEGMEIEVSKKRFYRVRKDYARMLMLSEWMLEVPEDFADKWIMIPCPVAKRVLIVARKGSTKMYNRQGRQLLTFKSVLPGGGPRSNRNSFSILDGFWSRDNKIIYVLDILAWSNQEMIECETEFRFYWFKTQLEELSELKEEKSGINDYSILPLPFLTCDTNFYEFLEKVSGTFPLDGLLFYHKETHYMSGKTPLALWLKAYMLPEVLSISVPDPYNEKPDSYIDFERHVLQVVEAERKRSENAQKRKQHRQKPEEEIEKVESEAME